MRKVLYKTLIPVLLFFTLLPAARADFNTGVVAYASGDYEKAFATMRSLAETSEHGLAQYYVAMMYLRGQGAEQSDTEASEWFRRAAKNRISQAQHKLGQMYTKGRGVPKDNELAYAWLLAAQQHDHPKATAALEKLKPLLSTDEVAAAEKLGTEYIEKYGPEKKADLSQPIQIDN